MFKVYTCITTQHDLRLVALAAVFCLFVATVAVSLFNRARVTRGRAQLAWLALVGVAGGFGIWATHFIATLAYEATGTASYDPGLTLLSLALSMLITGAGSAIALTGASRWLAALGGAVLGLGAAAMHYTGIMAAHIPYVIAWEPSGVLASVALAAGLGAMAMQLACRREDLLTTLGAAVLFALAVLSLHFTGMSAMIVLRAAEPVIEGATLAATSLALLMAAAAAAILGGCLIAALISRRSHTVIEQQKILLDIAIENMPQALCMYDVEGRATLFNSHYAKLFGIDAAALKGMSLLDQFKVRYSRGEFDGDPQTVFDKIVSEIRAGRPIVKTDHFVIPGRVLRVTEQPLAGAGWIATIEDITEWRKAQEQITHLARHDALTDLPNRTTFREELERVLRYAKRDHGVAVLYIDLDHFKEINDSLGHPVGDALLTEVSRRLVDCVREGDTVARLGGDEFAVVQISKHEPEIDAAALATRIVSIIGAPYEIQGHHVSIGTSVGIALAPTDGTTPDDLIKKADMALYRAKAEGRGNYRFFELDMDAHAQNRRLLTTELRAALAHDQFALHYQPIRDIESDAITCVEALLRWQHPLRGTVLPDKFLPLAEHSGLIVPIGDWVLQTACHDAARWHSQVRVAVNLSPSQFKHPRLVPSIAAALTASRLSPHRLELEINEVVLLQEGDGALATLRALRALGVRLSMDHFGAGYAALSSLQSFLFDRVKIDRSFVQSTDRHSDAPAAFGAIAGLGQRLGQTTSAAGVETVNQLAMLRDAGCMEIQGLLIDPPCTATEIKRLLEQNERRSVA